MIITSPGEAALDISAEVEACAARLNSAGDKEFFLLPVSDPRQAVPWILASFQSPLAVVPFSAQIPETARAKLLAQLPRSKVISLADLPAAKNHLKFEKPLDQVWAVIFSSGSSGDPKGVALSGSALRASAIAHAEHSGISGGTWLLNLPLYHIGGFSVISRAYFLKTHAAIAAVKFSAEEIVRWILAGQVTGLSLVPTAFRRLLSAMRTPWPASLQKVLIGGAPMPADLKGQAAEASAPVFYTYGMTEHCSQIATEQKTADGLLPLPGVELKISTDGEILLRSPCLASGIFLNGRLEALPEKAGFFPTGDLGELANGRLTVRGRKSDLILSGGINIFPAEIENELSGYAGISDFGVSGIADREWGEAVCLAVVTEGESPDYGAILDFLRRRLDGRKLPKHVISLPVIPRTALGKINRAALSAEIQKKILSGA